MASGTTVNLKLLIQATNKASATVESLRDQLNSVSKAAEELAKRSSKAGKTGSDAMKAFAASTAPLKDKLNKVHDALEGLGTTGAWLLGIAATLSATAFFPVKSAVDFQHEMSKVLAVTEGATERFSELKNVASELGRTTKFTAQEAASGMVFLGMAGMNAQEVIEGIGPSLKLATAAGIELAEAADIATNVVAAMRIPVEDLADAIDILANTTANSNTNMLQLADAMKYAGPLAAAAHVQLSEVAAIMGVLGSSGIQASMAGTAVRGMLRAIAAPTEKARQVLDDLNVTIETQADGSIDLVKVLHDLADAQLTTAQANAVFGRFAAAGTLAVTSHIKELDKLIVSNENAAGAARRMANIMEDNVKGSFIRLTSALDGLKRAFGDPLLAPIKEVIDTLTALVTVVTNTAEKFPVLTTALGIVTGAVIVVTGALGLMAIAIASIGFAAKQLAKILEIELVLRIAVLIKSIKQLTATIVLSTGVTARWNAMLVAARVVIIALGEAISKLLIILGRFPIILALVALTGFITFLKEWSNHNKVLIDENKKLVAEGLALYKSLDRTKRKLEELEVGSKKYTSATKALREELLHTAETHSMVREEAEKAANSIDQFTGRILDGGKAIEEYNRRVKEIALLSMQKQIEGVEEGIRRLNGTSEQFGRVWPKVMMGVKVAIGLVTGGLEGAKEAANKFAQELVRQEKILANLNYQYIELLQTIGELDKHITESELSVYLQTAFGKSKQEADKAAEAFQTVKDRLEDATNWARELKDVKIEELNVKVKVATTEVKKLREEYETAIEKSKEAIAEWNKLSEAEQKNAPELAKKVKEAFDVRTEASKSLAKEEGKTEALLTDLLKKRQNEDKKVYDESLKRAKKDKDTKVKQEWEYEIEKEKADKKYEEVKLKTLTDIQDKIVEAGLQETDLAKKVAKSIIDQAEGIKNAQENIDDAVLKHQREVADQIIQLHQEVEKERINMMQDGPEKIRAQAELEIDILEEKAKKIGIADKELNERRKQIREKAEKDIDDFHKEIRYAQEDADIESAKRTADRTVAEYERAYEEGRIGAKEYVEKSTKAITDAIDQEISLLEYRLEELKAKYGPDNPIVIDLEAKIKETKEQKTEVEGEVPSKTREAELQDLRNYYAEKDALLQAERDSMTENLNNAEEIAQKEKEILENKNNDILAAMEQAHIEKSVREKVANELSLQEKKAFADKEKAIDEMRYQWAADRAGQLSELFGDMYELGGRKQKGWFIAQKAMAIAQVIMSTQVAAMKVMEEGWVGIIHKALIYAQGAMSIAKIASASYAEGGEVKGKSPHKKADNIPIMATAKEWIMPVDTVQTYGKNVMEALRKKLIPPEIFQGYKLPIPVYAHAGRGYAEGGEVKPKGMGKTAGDVVVAPAPPINIVNIVDAGEMDRYLGSSAGQNAILNVLSSRREAVRRVIK